MKKSNSISNVFSKKDRVANYAIFETRNQDASQGFLLSKEKENYLSLSFLDVQKQSFPKSNLTNLSHLANFLRFSTSTWLPFSSVSLMILLLFQGGEYWSYVIYLLFYPQNCYGPNSLNPFESWTSVLPTLTNSKIRLD